jgi:ABC-type nitrate/sulfonate/bicarbonate transport system ATPase subunit
MAAMSDLKVDIRQKCFAAAGNAPPLVALQGLRFTASLGEFICVLGPSGCGKTTLLNIIAGLDRDYTGTILLPAGRQRPAPVIGYVFQKPRLLPWRTVEQNVGLVLTPEQRRTRMLDDLLTATELTKFRHVYPERLSVGMTRRVAIARAFAVEPDLLLMDEPFVSLDEQTADRLRVLLLDIWQRRPTTILFVSHNTREVVQLADRIVLLTPSPGRVDSLISVPIPRSERRDPAQLERLRRSLLGDRPEFS